MIERLFRSFFISMDACKSRANISKKTRTGQAVTFNKNLQRIKKKAAGRKVK